MERAGAQSRRWDLGRLGDLPKALHNQLTDVAGIGGYKDLQASIGQLSDWATGKMTIQSPSQASENPFKARLDRNRRNSVELLRPQPHTWGSTMKGCVHEILRRAASAPPRPGTLKDP
jgi:hypothetical protein